MNPRPALRPDITLDGLNELGTEYLPGFLGVDRRERVPGRLRSPMKLAQPHFAPHHFLDAARIVAPQADTPCGYATFAHLPEGAAAFTTLELKSNPLGTVREGALVCEAHVQHQGRTTPVWDAGVTDAASGRILALFWCTPMIWAENAVRRPQPRVRPGFPARHSSQPWGLRVLAGSQKLLRQATGFRAQRNRKGIEDTDRLALWCVTHANHKENLRFSGDDTARSLPEKIHKKTRPKNKARFYPYPDFFLLKQEPDAGLAEILKDETL